MISQIKSLLSSFRPKTLTASIVPVLTTAAMAVGEGYKVRGFILFCILLSAVCIQVGTNLVNDASDFKKGADTHERLGPQRVTQAGIFSYTQVMILATFFFLLSIVFAVPLVFLGGWPLVILGGISILMGYAYTSGPFPLAYKGLGDLFVILFFGWLAVGGTYYLLIGEVTGKVFLLGLQIGALSTILIAINNLRDIDQDRVANKKTLVVRFGKKFGDYEVGALMALSFGIGFYWIFQKQILAGLLPWTLLPFAKKLFFDIRKERPSIRYNHFLAKAAFLQLMFCVQLCLGFLLGKNIHI